MNREVKRVPLTKAALPQLTRVAAYARVSPAKDAMRHSLLAQVSYYSGLIQRHPGWAYAGVYSDEAKTGTKDSREGFTRLLADCRAGRVDAGITKSISRFARNTVTLLEMVRELKGLGVDVYFEEQNIHTLSADGELMLSILASYAQEESLSASENQKWRIRKNFEEGRPWNGTLLGYRYRNGTLVIEPAEAKIVRRVFREYLAGKGVVAIANGLNEDGIPTRYGNRWCKAGVSCVLRNYTYTGNLLLQKTFREDHLNKRTLPNEGQLPQYHAEGSHEAIISMEDYEAAQAEMVRRAEKHAPPGKGYRNRYPFTGLIVCGYYGKHYRRKVTAAETVWICVTYNTLGKAACPSKQIPEPVLTDLTADMDIGDLTEICAEDGNRLVFRFKDGIDDGRTGPERKAGRRRCARP